MSHSATPTGEVNLRIAREELGNLPQKALSAGIIGLAGCGLIALVPAFRSQMVLAWLLGFLFWLYIALGSLAILMIQYLSGGGWGLVIRRTLEAATRTLYWMPFLFIPILVFHHDIYEWSHADVVARDIILTRKAFYLNSGFWMARTLLYFVIWASLAFLLNTWSLAHDRTGDPAYYVRMKYLSGPGAPLYVLSVLFASVDWVMSLEPHWFSTIFGAVQGIGQVLGAMAFTAVVVTLLARFRPMNMILNVGHLHDMGKFLLGFTMIWAYFNISQFLIIWSANIAEETPWYLARMRNGWAPIGGMVLFFHFMLPFVLLLSRDLKRNPRTLVGLALYIVGIRFVDMYFTIIPSARIFGGPEGLISPILLFGPLAWLGVGGLWLSKYLVNLTERDMLPVNDPDLKEALEVHGH